MAELRRKDVDQKKGALYISRAIVRAEGSSSVPQVRRRHPGRAIPPHLLPFIVDYIKTYAEPGPDILLFPSAGSGHLSTSRLHRVYYQARRQPAAPISAGTTCGTRERSSPLRPTPPSLSQPDLHRQL